MLARLRRFLDIRAGEVLPVALTFLYIAAVVAAFLLAKSIRNALYLKEYGAEALAYVYAAVPIAVSMFVPISNRIAARFGQRSVTIGTLGFFAANVLLFWYGFHFHAAPILAGVFYVWVNCFGIIATVQAWSFANSLFDTRQARRLFGLVGSGASLGAILGGFLARMLVGPVGGAVNLLFVLAILIAAAAGIVIFANARIRRRGLARRGKSISRRFRETLQDIRTRPYLRHLAVMVFLVAIVTEWTSFQLSLLAGDLHPKDATALARFFGTFNVFLGIVAFVVQLTLTGPVLRKFGVGVTILLLPAALWLGSASVMLLPGLITVAMNNAFDQGLRFSVDKATYELLYLPIAPGARAPIKNAIDIVVNRIGDGIGGVLLGIATGGFLGLPGLHFGLRGIAAANVALTSIWLGVAWRLRREYVRTIRDSIHQHRLDAERASRSVLDRLAADALASKLSADDPEEVLYALSVIEAQRVDRWRVSLRALLGHPDAEVRRRSLALLSEIGDRAIAPIAGDLLRDPDLGVRTEALLFLAREMGIDPLARIEELGDFADFSIRAGMAAFLSSPGPSRNLEAARAILEQMVETKGADGVQDRAEAARVLALVPGAFDDLLSALIRDEDPSVASHAVATARVLVSPGAVDALIEALRNPAIGDEAAEALARYGNDVVPTLQARLLDDAVPLDVRREIPIALVRIGSAEAGHALIEALLQGDATVRYRVIASLNKLRRLHPEVTIDRGLVELLLAAEIAGHYRSYQVLGALRPSLADEDSVVQAVRQSMDQELERIFRLMSLLFPDADLQDAYVGLRSTNPTIRANALEFLDNVLAPALRQLIVPVLDPQVTLAERIALGNRFVGAPLTSAEQAIATLLGSEDAWLQTSAAQAVGVLRLHGLAPQLTRLASSADEHEWNGLHRETRQEPPAEMGMGVG